MFHPDKAVRAAQRAERRREQIATDPVGTMAKDLHARWAKIFAWASLGLLEWDSQTTAQFRVAYRTYHDFCVRHGRTPLGYGAVDFATGREYPGAMEVPPPYTGGILPAPIGLLLEVCSEGDGEHGRS